MEHLEVDDSKVGYSLIESSHRRRPPSPFLARVNTFGSSWAWQSARLSPLGRTRLGSVLAYVALCRPPPCLLTSRLTDLLACMSVCVSVSVSFFPPFLHSFSLSFGPDIILGGWLGSKLTFFFLFRCFCVLFFLFFSFLSLFLFFSSPQWGAADAEIKVPSGENTELKSSPFKAWSRSVYSHTCYAYCQGLLPCLFLPFRSIYMHFFQNLSRFFLCWLWLAHGSFVGPRNKIGHPVGCRFPCWMPAENK